MSGFDTMPDKDMFTSCFVSDDVKDVATFNSNNERLNSIFKLYYYAQRSNMVGNYTDCPQREKQGWTGDASVTKKASSIIFNDYTTAESFMRTMYLNIFDDGRPSCIVPHISTDKALYEEYDIPWSSAYFTFPYFTYMQTGDPYYLEMAYPYLIDVFEYYKKDIEYNRYGDWLGYDNHEGLLDRSALTASYFYYCGTLLSEMAEIIGVDHTELDEYLESTQDFLWSKYFKETYFSTNTQTANAMALDFKLVPDEIVHTIRNGLREKVKEDGYTLRTGVLGTYSLYNAMSMARMHKELMDITLNDKKCSFGYMLDNGATTMWEYWDKAGGTFNSNLSPDRFAGWDSQNHCMMGGGLVNWIFEGLGGIVNYKEGYKEIWVRPGVESGLERVNTSIETLRGTIVTTWTQKAGTLNLDVTVPANCRAYIVIPFSDARTITESGKNILGKDGKDIKYVGRVKGEGYVYLVGSGTYKFVASDKESWIPKVIIILLFVIFGVALYFVKKDKKRVKGN